LLPEINTITNPRVKKKEVCSQFRLLQSYILAKMVIPIKKLDKVRWDSIIIELVNIKLKNIFHKKENTHHIELDTKIKRVNTFQRKRSPEEFQAYLRELFDYEYPNFRYHWYFSAGKKRKNKYHRVYA